MRVQGACDYALRALIEVALREGGDPLSAEEISAAQGIPTHFLQNILAALGRAGLVRGIRGHAGGWLLARGPADINVAEVMEAVNGPLVTVQGLAPEELDYNATADPLRQVWLCVRETLHEVLDAVTLQQLLRNRPETRLPGGRVGDAPSVSPVA